MGLVIGNEGEGVSRLIKETCDFVASIPMKGDIDSLNASVAAGVWLLRSPVSVDNSEGKQDEGIYRVTDEELVKLLGRGYRGYGLSAGKIQVCCTPESSRVLYLAGGEADDLIQGRNDRTLQSDPGLSRG